MSDDNRFGGNSRTPAGGNGTDQDFGFFATPRVEPPSHFDGPPVTAPAYPPPALRPVAPPPFGVQPQQHTPGQFGLPADPYAQPWQPAPGHPYAPAQRSGLPVWAIVAICVPVTLFGLGILAAVAIPVLLNQLSTPVMPRSIGGRSKSTDPFMKAQVDGQRKEMRQQLPGRKVEAQGYGNGVFGYELMGFNMRLDSTRVFSDFGVTGGPTDFGDVRCANNADKNTSMCIRTGTRGGIVLAQFGGGELSGLAAETEKAWSAQPFAD